jgi:type II secretory pathway pseudopilin PulG
MTFALIVIAILATAASITWLAACRVTGERE